jgi:SepF-like predicted cell division protein (DUF552 family)
VKETIARKLTKSVAKRNTSSLSQKDELCIKSVSIHNYSQISKLEENLSYKDIPVILIARITPLLVRNLVTGTKFVNKLYSTASKNNYTVFRLGEERIIVVPNEVQVQSLLS